MKKIEVKTWLYYFLAFLHTSCSYAQKEESSQKPRIHIDVKKETDKYGNIIRYDSTYSWSWSNIDSEDSFKMIDSMYSKLLKDRNYFFDVDSLFLKPFSFSIFDDDWFNFDKQMEKMLQQHREFMKQHDEIMKQFFQPNIIIPEPKQQKNEPQNNNKPTKTNNNSGIDI